MKILIADDHPLYRDALRTQLEHMIPEAVVTEAASLDEVMELSKNAQESFQLFLLDYHMPGMSSDTLKLLAGNFPGIPIAVISGTMDAANVREVVQAGAHGFIPKTANRTYLMHALKFLLAGGTSVPTNFAFQEIPATDEPPPAAPDAVPWIAQLTSRERDVLRGVVRGLSNKEIGRELELVEVTVKLHLSSIFRKTGARTRSEVAVFATKANLFS